MDIKLDFVPPWLINFISRQLIGSGHKLYQKAVSTVAACDEDYKKALRAPLYVRIREYQYSADNMKITPIDEDANVVLPENPTVHNPLAVTNLAPSSEIVEEESEQNTSFKVDHLATGFSNQPTEQAQQVENKPFISPEVEQALGILDTAIAVIQGKRSGNISALQKFLGYDATLEEGSAIDSRNSHANILDADNLPNRHPITTPPRDSRELRQASSLPDEKVRDREDVFDSDSPKSMTASTITKTKSTLRSTTKVHEEESLNTNGLHQNGFCGDKEPRRARKTSRWLCCLTTSTIG